MVDQQKSLINMKTIIVGKSTVGKSTILLRFVEGAFKHQNTTVAVDYRFKKVTAGGKTFNFELWDTAGQQRYRTIVFSFFKLSKAAIVVFDLTNQSSLTDVKGWMQQIVVHCGKEIPILLLGNKSDLLSPIDLKKYLQKIKPNIEKLKQEYGCQFFSVSAKNGQNIEIAFSHLAEMLALTISSAPVIEAERKPFKLDDPDVKKKGEKKKERCCSSK